MRNGYRQQIVAWAIFIIIGHKFANSMKLDHLIAQMPPGEILFSFGNIDYLPFHLHWICNTAAWSEIHERTLIVTDDRASMRAIQSLSNRVRVFVLPEGSKAYGFYSKGYRQLTIQRVAVLVEILKTGRGVVMFEGDAVWTRNVLEDPNVTDSKRLHDLALYRDGSLGEMIGAGECVRFRHKYLLRSWLSCVLML
jgi:hypothetical protein